MIYTLTMNPAIDMNIIGDGLYPNMVNRTRNAVYTPNGKGLNVSVSLCHYGIKSCTLGFYGGFSGRYIVEMVPKMGIGIKPCWIDGTTRINVFYNDGKTEYKLVNEGPYVSEKNLKELQELMLGSDDMELLVISGSLPQGVSEASLETISLLCREKKIPLVLDVCTSNYRQLLALRPYLIKPNDEELRIMLGIIIESERDVILALQKLYELGALHILLTLGEKGSYFFDSEHMYYANARKIKFLSSACAGDVALGAFLSVFWKNSKLVKEAMITASAAGANAAEQEGPGDFAHAAEYEKDIQVREIEWQYE